MVLQSNRMSRFGHPQRKEDHDWVKKYVEYPKLSCPGCKGRPNVTGLKLANKHLKELGIYKADAL